LIAAPPENYVQEVIAKAGSGVAVSAEKSEEFIEAATMLLENAELRGRCAVNARAWAEKNFDIARIADRFLTFFEHAGTKRALAVAESVSEASTVR